MAPVAQKTCNTCGRVYASADAFLRGTHSWRVCAEGHLWFSCACDSTLMLPKGKYPWFDPAARVSSESRSLFNEVARRGLPHPPSAVMKLMQSVESETSSALELERALRAVPGLAVSVLGLANGAQAHARHTIRTLEQAVSSLGRTVLKQIVLAAPIESVVFPTKVFNRATFWNEARHVAHVASVLSLRLLPQESPDEAFLAGFLANVGKVVQALCFSEVTDRLQGRVAAPIPPCSWNEAETLEHAPPHELLGEIACVLWGLPDYVRFSASHHHRPLPSALRWPKLAEVVGLALQFSHWICNRPERVDAATFHRLCARFALSEREAFELVRMVRTQVEDRLRQSVEWTIPEG